jgi:hypothetical protein
MLAVARTISDYGERFELDHLAGILSGQSPIRSMPGMLAVPRARRDELQLTHETIDDIAGWPAGYASKLFAPDPIKNLGWMSLGAALDTLAIELVPVENAEQRKLVEGRWTRRLRPHPIRQNCTAL